MALDLRCPRCGSDEVIPDSDLRVTGAYSQQVVLKQAKGAAPGPRVSADVTKADVCCRCGHVAVRVGDLKPLRDEWRRRIVQEQA